MMDSINREQTEPKIMLYIKSDNGQYFDGSEFSNDHAKDKVFGSSNSGYKALLLARVTESSAKLTSLSIEHWGELQARWL
jgi:hypothetical protein